MGSHGCQDVVRLWQDLAKTAKMLVRWSTREVILDHVFNPPAQIKYTYVKPNIISIHEQLQISVCMLSC